MSYYKRILFLIILLLPGCSLTGGHAVIENEALTQKTISQLTFKKQKNLDYYVVGKGDTVYSIAFAYSQNFKDIARWNHLDSNFTIHPGQLLVVNAINPAAPQQSVLKLKTPHKTTTNKTKPRDKVKIHAKNTPKAQKNISNKSKQKSYAQKKQKKEKKYFKNVVKRVKYWSWPVDGKVVKSFSGHRTGNKGIDIAGKYGSPIKAVASGKVVYSGSGLRGYGNLLIIKHNDEYLSAYAYNKELLVNEGHSVKAGDVIAKMGKTNAGKVSLHFEVRRNGKPVNPLRYLR